MSAVTSIELDWGDGRYTFHLDIPRIEELQNKTGIGPSEILQRLTEGRAKIADIRETIRLGLIGGKTSPKDAMRLVQLYVDQQPLVESIAYATLILGAAVIGNKPESDDKEEDPQPGNGEAAETSGSTSPPSSPAPS